MNIINKTFAKKLRLFMFKRLENTDIVSSSLIDYQIIFKNLVSLIIRNIPWLQCIPIRLFTFIK